MDQPWEVRIAHRHDWTLEENLTAQLNAAHDPEKLIKLWAAFIPLNTYTSHPHVVTMHWKLTWEKFVKQALPLLLHVARKADRGRLTIGRRII